jgi:hypothetical protein
MLLAQDIKESGSFEESLVERMKSSHIQFCLFVLMEQSDVHLA